MEKSYFFPLSPAKDKKVDPFLQIDLWEDLEGGFSQHVWPSAPILVRYLMSRRADICGKTILELGGGPGLPSIAAAMLGSNVFLSDDIENEKWMHLAKRNITENEVESKVKIIPIQWADFTEESCNLPKIDYIIASDCFYDKNLFEDLICTVEYYIEQNPKLHFWTTYQNRAISNSFRLDNLFKKWAMVCEEVPLSTFDGEYYFTSIGEEGKVIPADPIDEANFRLWDICRNDLLKF